MAQRENRLSTQAVDADLLSPDSLQTDALYDYEHGGIALNDPSEGLQYQTWVAYPSGDDIVFEDEVGNVTTVVTVAGGPKSLSMSFDQNMRPHVAYVDSAGDSHLLWYDTSISQQVDQVFAGISNPRLAHDDKRDLESDSSDIIFAYVRDGGLYFRQQRDRYTVEYTLDPSIGTARLRNVGMGKNNRLHYLLS